MRRFVVTASALALMTGMITGASAQANTDGGGPDDPVQASAVTAAAANDHARDLRKRRAIKVAWDWTMPAGMPAASANGIPNTPMQPVPSYPEAGNSSYGPLPTGPNTKYDVVLDASTSQVRGSNSNLQCSWNIRTTPATTLPKAACGKAVRVALPEGTWPLTLTVLDTKTGASRSATSGVVVRNVLMNISGDSYASGEGFGPIRTSAGKIDWDDGPCRRSRWSGFVRAAVQVEQADPRSNVTLVDVACSGAEIEEQDENPGVSVTGGMLSPQRHYLANGSTNSDPATYTYAPPQIDQLSTIGQGTEWDVSLMSIGGNDAGLSPVVGSCLAWDAAGLLFASLNDDPNFQPDNGYPNCYQAPLAAVDLASAVPLPKCVEGGDWPTCDGPKLPAVVDNNLNLLEQHFAQLAPCLAATGGAPACQTVKLVNGKPQTSGNKGVYTSSDPIEVTSVNNIAQAMYPDLTQTASGSSTDYCSVQSDPSLPLDVSNLPLSLLKPPLLMSPMQQIDNAFAFKSLYEGQKGKAIALPFGGQAGDSPAPTYPGNWAALPVSDPNPIVPNSNGIATQIRFNEQTYGWHAAMSMYEASHPHGLCSPTRWVSDLTETLVLGAQTGGAGLHPNEDGQEAYEAMLAPLSKQIANVPVAVPPTKDVPPAKAVNSKSKLKLLTKRVTPEKRARMRLQVTTPGSNTAVTGRVLIRGNNSTNSRQLKLRLRLKAADKGKLVVRTPRSWTALSSSRSRGNLRVSARYLGNETLKMDRSNAVRVHIRTGPAKASGLG